MKRIVAQVIILCGVSVAYGVVVKGGSYFDRLASPRGRGGQYTEVMRQRQIQERLQREQAEQERRQAQEQSKNALIANISSHFSNNKSLAALFSGEESFEKISGMPQRSAESEIIAIIKGMNNLEAVKNLYTTIKQQNLDEFDASAQKAITFIETALDDQKALLILEKIRLSFNEPFPTLRDIVADFPSLFDSPDQEINDQRMGSLIDTINDLGKAQELYTETQKIAGLQTPLVQEFQKNLALKIKYLEIARDTQGLMQEMGASPDTYYPTRMDALEERINSFTEELYTIKNEYLRNSIIKSLEDEKSNLADKATEVVLQKQQEEEQEEEVGSKNAQQLAIDEANKTLRSFSQNLAKILEKGLTEENATILQAMQTWSGKFSKPENWAQDIATTILSNIREEVIAKWQTEIAEKERSNLPRPLVSVINANQEAVEQIIQNHGFSEQAAKVLRQQLTLPSEDMVEKILSTYGEDVPETAPLGIQAMYLATRLAPLPDAVDYIRSITKPVETIQKAQEQIEAAQEAASQEQLAQASSNLVNVSQATEAIASSYTPFKSLAGEMQTQIIKTATNVLAKRTKSIENTSRMTPAQKVAATDDILTDVAQLFNAESTIAEEAITTQQPTQKQVAAIEQVVGLVTSASNAKVIQTANDSKSTPEARNVAANSQEIMQKMNNLAEEMESQLTTTRKLRAAHLDVLLRKKAYVRFLIAKLVYAVLDLYAIHEEFDPGAPDATELYKHKTFGIYAQPRRGLGTAVAGLIDNVNEIPEDTRPQLVTLLESIVNRQAVGGERIVRWDAERSKVNQNMRKLIQLLQPPTIVVEK